MLDSAWPVIVLYHLYAGLSGLIQFSTVGDKVAWMAGSVSDRLTYPAMTAVISTVFAFFIPSSGGQFAIRGFVATKSAMAVGISINRGMLALGVGDHMGNFPLAVLVRRHRRDGAARFQGVLRLRLVFGALWFLIGVVVFTFAPC